VTFVTTPIRDVLGEAAADAARDEEIADVDLVGALHVLDVAELYFVSSPLPRTKRAGAGALHDGVDRGARVDDEPHVDGVARALDAWCRRRRRREDREVRRDVAC
jgi:hypothetical protein